MKQRTQNLNIMICLLDIVICICAFEMKVRDETKLTDTLRENQLTNVKQTTLGYSTLSKQPNIAGLSSLS